MNNAAYVDISFFSNVIMSQILCNRLNVLRYTENWGQLSSTKITKSQILDISHFALTPYIYVHVVDQVIKFHDSLYIHTHACRYPWTYIMIFHWLFERNFTDIKKDSLAYVIIHRKFLYSWYIYVWVGNTLIMDKTILKVDILALSWSIHFV